MATNFPTIQKPSYPFNSKLEDISLQSQMEDGTVVSRARFTRSRETFTLTWTALPDADYATLRTFYKSTVKGGSEAFQWTYPTITGDSYSGQTFTVRFVGGGIEFSKSKYGTRSGTLQIQEV